jgi:serine/threonine protein phosphatase PrpC
VFYPGGLAIAHAGDSRCYRLRNGIMEQLTADHSYVADLVRNKLISIEEARNHPFAHIISRSIGPIEDVDLEIKTYERRERDRYLFCSDGLTVHLEDIEIETILYDASNPYDAAKNLLYTALRSGGEDNITVLCVFT